MITREALNAGGKFTPPCDCWMPSCPPCPRPTGRASKPRGRKPACPPMPCHASCPCRASPNAGRSSWQRRSHRRLRTHPRGNPPPLPRTRPRAGTPQARDHGRGGGVGAACNPAAQGLPRQHLAPAAVRDLPPVPAAIRTAGAAPPPVQESPPTLATAAAGRPQDDLDNGPRALVRRSAQVLGIRDRHDPLDPPRPASEPHSPALHRPATDPIRSWPGSCVAGRSRSPSRPCAPIWAAKPSASGRPRPSPALHLPCWACSVGSP